MALLATQVPLPSGLAPAYAAASAGGDTYTPGANVVLHAKNGSGAAITVTVDSRVLCSQGVDHDLAVSVPAAGERMIGPLTPGRFGDSSGIGGITYSGVTNLTVAVLGLG